MISDEENKGECAECNGTYSHSQLEYFRGELICVFCLPKLKAEDEPDNSHH